LSIISIAVLTAGVIFDGLMYGTMNALDTCGDSNTGEIYGETANVPYLISCAVDHHQDCLCIQSSHPDRCYLFNLEAADNCDQVLVKYPSLLLASVLFELVLMIVVFFYSICTCNTLCCVRTTHYSGNTAPSTGSAAVYVTAY
jgi:hypothetical protein